MAVTLNDTPSANRLHIGIFGKTNSGKSSFINTFTNQEVSIVADIAGTTTDPVYKAMEIHPLGPCTIIDTAGFDDESMLGEQRIERTKLAAEKTDLAVILFAADEKQGLAACAQELKWYRFFKEKNTPVLLVINKVDLADTKVMQEEIKKETGENALVVSAKTGVGMDQVKEALSRKVPENFGERLITGDLVPALATLVKPPKLIITDSQVFAYVYENKPKESMLTSFSVLFAAYKGDLPYYVEGAKQIDRLTENSHVLIAECCTHAPLSEDIGRVKIPRMLRKRFGENMQIDHVSGTDFPEKLTEYDLIIQCGACMFNRKYVLSRIDRAKEQAVPMTNYGVTIAHLTGILDHVVMP